MFCLCAKHFSSSDRADFTAVTIAEAGADHVHVDFVSVDDANAASSGRWAPLASYFDRFNFFLSHLSIYSLLFVLYSSFFRNVIYFC